MPSASSPPSKTNGQTGVEMEALTAASVAALTLYDMIKAVDKGAVIESVRLLAKSGGKSGDYKRRRHAALAGKTDQLAPASADRAKPSALMGEVAAPPRDCQRATPTSSARRFAPS